MMLKSDANTLSYGNANLLNSKTVVILNSRHGKFPKGSDPWVRNTISATKSAICRGKTIIASYGMNTWEIVLWACGEFNGNVIVILPISMQDDIVDNLEYFMHDYGLNLNKCVFKLVHSDSAKRSKKSWWDARDKLAVDMAYEIMPVSIRKDGRWSKVLKSPIINGKRINREFQIEYNHKAERSRMAFEIPHYGISYKGIFNAGNLNCDNLDCGISYDNDFLIHWTRRFSCRWPSERSADYIKAIVNSHDKYPRGADSTLERILSEKLLRGSSARIKNGKHAVGFTDLPPHESIKLMKWRKRYCRYTFEPYGIAIRKETAIDAGIRAVRYVNKEKSLKTRGLSTETRGLSPLSDEYTQTYSKGEWWRESEWRFIGNLDLFFFNLDDVRVIIPFQNQIRRFTDISKFNVISLEQMGIILKTS